MADLSPDDARTRLYEIMNQDMPFGEKARQALELGQEYLRVENGHLARIDVGAAFWEAVVSTDPADGEFPPGLVLDYQETYCRLVVEEDETLGVHDAPQQGLTDDPAYQKHGLKTYHGTPLRVDGSLYGTLCFVDSEAREEPFTESERLFVELIARMLEHELMLMQRQQELSLSIGINTVLSRVLRHNIRNDLNVIQGVLELLHERSGGEERLYENANRRIVDLLGLAEKAREIESIAHARSDRRPIEVTSLVQSIIDRLRPEYPSATFTLESDDDVGLDAIPTLRQALRELLENAAKHAGEAPAIAVKIQEVPEGVGIEIQDNGPGIPDQELAVLDEGTETPLVHGSGLGLWMTYLIISEHEGTIAPVVTEEGTTVRLTIPRAETPPDVSDRDSLLRMFHREQDRFEAVFEESMDAIVISDDDGRYIEANDSASELFGVPRRNLLGRRIEEFAPRDFSFEDAWTTFRQSENERGEFPLIRPDGTERIVEYGASPEILPGEHLSILRDATERREREERFRAIFDNMYQFTGLLDSEGTILEANATALEFGGLDLDQVVGEPMWETYWFQASSKTRQKAKRAVERANEREFVQAELLVQGRDSETRIDFSVRPVLDEEGEVAYIVAEGRDISHRHNGTSPIDAVS